MKYGARLGHQGKGLGSSLDDSALNAPEAVGDTLLTDQRKQHLARVILDVVELMALPCVVKLQHMLETELSQQATERGQVHLPHQLTTSIKGLHNIVFNATYSGSYDGDGNLLQSSDANGIVHQQSYDALHRLVQRIDNLNGTSHKKGTEAIKSE